MAFFYSKRKLRIHEHTDIGELNIVPYLDILMNLIMFMLLSITGLSAFGILNVNAPNYGPAAQVTDEGERPKMLLSGLISKRGFYVAATGGGPGEEQGPPHPHQAPPRIPHTPPPGVDHNALTHAHGN